MAPGKSTLKIPQREALEQRLALASANPMRATRQLALLRDALASAPRTQRLGLTALVQVLAASPAAANMLIAQPAYVHALLGDDALALPTASEVVQQAVRGPWAPGAKPASPSAPGSAWLEAVAQGTQDDAVPAVLPWLRRVRMGLWLRAVVREVSGLAAPATTGAELSLLAERLLQRAWQHLRQQDEAEHGTWQRAAGGRDEVALVLLGQGKLGAYDLNVSSDIDVQCLALRLGESGCEQPLGEVTTRLEHFVRHFVASISEQTADGFLYRVDLDLRPFGRSGPLIQSVAAAESYYEVHGAPWERMALVRARALAGDAHVATRFLERVLPFTYPKVRSAPFVATIRAQRRRAAPPEPGPKGAPVAIDVKRARGAIRDIELFVQVHQVLLGGHRPRLRTTELLPAIAALQADGALMLGEATLLRRSYLFLRRIENTLQSQNELQTHTLPICPAALDELAAVLRARGPRDDCRVRSGAHLVRRVRRTLEHVARLTERLDDTQSAAAGLRGTSARRRLLVRTAQSHRGPEGRAARIALRFAADDSVHAQLIKLATMLARTSLTPHERTTLGDALVHELADTPNPSLALGHLVQLLPALSSHRGYVRLLLETPLLRRRLVDLLGSSAWLGRLVVRHPDLIDLLAHTPLGYGRESLLTRADLRRELDARLAPIVTAPLRWAALRAFLREHTLGAALGYLGQTLSPKATLSALGRMTEAALGVALALCEPPAWPPGEGLSVLALGRLGVGQLAFGSDVDLVFVSGTRDPERLAAQTLWLQGALKKLAQQPEGQGIHIDLRLRPYGSAGPLITTGTGLLHYFRSDARLWERQAFLKARPVALDVALGERTLGALHETLFAARLGKGDIEEAKRVRAAMRDKAERAHGPSNTVFDLKAGEGGLADIELGTQLLQLALGHEHPAVRVPGIFDALCALGTLELPLRENLAQVARSWTALRKLELAVRLGEGGGHFRLSLSAPELEPLALQLGYLGPRKAQRLLRELSHHRARARRYFATVVRFVQRARAASTPS